jgi:hypothetical protein
VFCCCWVLRLAVTAAAAAAAAAGVTGEILFLSFGRAEERESSISDHSSDDTHCETLLHDSCLVVGVVDGVEAQEEDVDDVG